MQNKGSIKSRFFSIALPILILGSAGWTAEKENQPTEKSKNTQEHRNQMANAHDQMAACLRSDKPLETCHNEMRERCRDSEDACLMMGGGRHGMMMMGKGKKHGPKSDAPESKEDSGHSEHH